MIHLISFTEQGQSLAERLAQALDGQAVRCNQGWTLDGWTQEHFQLGNALIFVGAAGIAVRAVAPYVRSKTTDPAVVVVDEMERFAIPLLSGHLGGANELAGKIAAVCGAIPVITTATDLHGLFAVDQWAKKQNCAILNPEGIKKVSGALLAGRRVEVCSPWPIAGGGRAAGGGVPAADAQNRRAGSRLQAGNKSRGAGEGFCCPASSSGLLLQGVYY